MNREDVIRLALEAGLFDDDQEPLPEYLEHFANLVVEEIANLVIEECAKVCDDQAEYADEHLTDSAWRSADRCAAAIRRMATK